MSAWPDAAVVQAFLARVSRRVRLIAAAEGAAIGLAVALAVGIIAVILSGGAAGSGIAAAAAIVGLLAGALLAAWRVPLPAPLVERRAPQSRNIVLTAAELIAAPARVPPHIGARVCADAARTVRSLDPARLFPARRALLALGAAVLTWSAAIAVLLLSPAAIPALPAAVRAATGPPSIDGVEVTITRPAYAGGAPEHVVDPARIEALAGSEVRLAVRTRAAAVRIETLGGRDSLRRSDAAFVGALVVDADGYIAIEAVSADGRSTRRLIGVTVTPDRSPVVHITAPGEDLTVPDGDRTIAVGVDASDDIGMDGLELTFTRVSGFGEQHTFIEGVVPLTIARDSANGWRARGVLRLDTLRLEPGDMVVYRAAARDARPGAAAAVSDAFIVELAAPGDIPAEGFSTDDEDRYALSQQMVLLKTERLIARAPSLPSDSLERAAAEIAAEQRSVRAEFVFMMGGELAEDIAPEESMEDLDEAAHAELDDEAIAGRLWNRGRADLLRAIRAMSRANAALLEVDLPRARAAEREAIDLLQLAFSRTRYILRALTQREQLDLSRRLTGDLAGVGRNAWPAADPVASPRIAALRRALADIAALTDTRAAGRAGAAAEAAIEVLRIDPSAEPLRRIAADLDSVAMALAEGNDARAGALLDHAAVQLAGSIRAELGRASAPAIPFETARLRGALTDALRRERP